MASVSGKSEQIGVNGRKYQSTLISHGQSTMLESAAIVKSTRIRAIRAFLLFFSPSINDVNFVIFDLIMLS